MSEQPVNDIENREPFHFEKGRSPDGLNQILKKVGLDLDNQTYNRVKGVLEALAFGAIVSTLGLIIWTLTAKR